MEDVKEKIIASARVLFAQNGCKRITMDEVSNSLRMSKRTLYEQFANKEELIKACIDDWNRRLEKEALRIEGITDSPVWRMLFMGKLFQRYGMINQLFLADMEKYYPELYNTKLCVPLNLRTEHLRRQLQNASEQGFFREGIDLGIASMLMTNCTYHVLNSKAIPIEERTPIIREFMVNYMRGMLTLKAAEEYDNNKERMLKMLEETSFESLRL